MPSQVLILLRTAIDAEPVRTALVAAGGSEVPLGSLSRVLSFTGLTVANVQALEIQGIETVEDGNAPVRGTADQPLEINAALDSASWGIARVIRRRAPWPVRRLQFPRSTFFRCVRTGAGVDLYVVDTGVLPGHDEFSGRAASIYEYYSSGGAGDNHGHGSGVASCAAGATVGLARAVSIWSCKVLDSDNAGTNAGLISGLSQVLTHYAGRSRPAVCNLSLGGFGAAVNSAVSDLIDAGIVVCASAGNLGADLGAVEYYPAESDPDAIVVGGTNPADSAFYRTGSASNYGTRIDVSAPGIAIRQATIGASDAFTLRTGTSFSVAFASGAVACMLTGHAKLTGRAQVQAVRAYVRDQATTGRAQPSPSLGLDLPDRLLYLDPSLTAPTAIPGLSDPPTISNFAILTKLLAQSVLGPPNDRLSISKLVAYTVVQPVVVLDSVIAVYPESLPNPRVADISATERRRLPQTSTTFEATAKSRDRISRQNLTWTFRPDQAEIFDEWWQTDLEFGGMWFTAYWPSPRGFIAIDRKFIDTPRWTHIGNGVFDVSVICEVRDIKVR